MKLHELLSEDFLIQHENKQLSSFFTTSLKRPIAIITDDHDKHIKAHLKHWYNPYAWLHMLSHLLLKRQKKKLGISHITTDSILSQFLDTEKNRTLDMLMEQDPKTSSWH